MSEHWFEFCAPFDYERLYGVEKYGLQNMCLRAVNMPSFAYPNEQIYENWDDRIPDAFWDNAKLIKSHYNGDAFFAGATEESFLQWANAVFSQVNGKPIVLTGAAVIRYTNRMSGYPTLRLTGIIATENLNSRPYGIESRREPRFDDIMREY
jgi:hypothetical protein